MAWRAKLWWFGLLGVAVFLGCAGRPSAPGAQENTWRRLQTDHFDLFTDLGEADAIEASVALERTRAALLQAAWSSRRATRQTQRIRVIVLASMWDFQHYFPSTTAAIHFNIGGETIALWGKPDTWETRSRTGEYSNSNLRHELVHHLAAGIYLREPRWFAEGMAQFWETIIIADDGKSALVGRPNADAFRSYLTVRSISVKDALAWGKPSALDAQYALAGLYGLSWAMVHWMYNARPDAFAAYHTALMRGDDPDRAWTANFGADEDAIDATIYQYLHHGQFAELPVDLQPSEVHPVPATVTAADVQAIRAQLALVAAEQDPNHPYEQEAESHLAAALALEPGNVPALRLSQRLDKKIPNEELISRLRNETTRRPDDGEAWLFLGSLLQPSEREPALRKALALLPNNATAYNNLAWHLLQTNRADEALPLATKASFLAPWSAVILDTYAAALFTVGRCPDAIRIQLRAVDNVPEQQRDKTDARSITATLERYRASCGAAAA